MDFNLYAVLDYYFAAPPLANSLKDKGDLESFTEWFRTHVDVAHLSEMEGCTNFYDILKFKIS